ncbi:MAG: domain 2, partial [Verrucomicrobiales bacterium]|nr:domain 2 [Verrucomicrobiales bacterium]
MKRYYLFLNNAPDGPWDAGDILGKVKKGEITRDSLVGEEGGCDWAPAHEVFSELATPPSAVPAPTVPPVFRNAPPPMPGNATQSPANPYTPPTSGYRAEPLPRDVNLDIPLVMDGAFIPGTEDLTAGQVLEMIRKGGRFAVWQYNFSILVMSFRRSSGIRFIRPGESGFLA